MALSQWHNESFLNNKRVRSLLRICAERNLLSGVFVLHYSIYIRRKKHTKNSTCQMNICGDKVKESTVRVRERKREPKS